MGAIKVETVVNYLHNGHKNRLFKTRRSPTRFYYIANNKRVYVESKEITIDVARKIPYQPQLIRQTKLSKED